MEISTRQMEDISRIVAAHCDRNPHATSVENWDAMHAIRKILGRGHNYDRLGKRTSFKTYLRKQGVII